MGGKPWGEIPVEVEAAPPGGAVAQLGEAFLESQIISTAFSSFQPGNCTPVNIH